MKTLRKAVITSLGILPFFAPIDFARAESTSSIKDDLQTNAQELPWKKSRFILEAQTGSRSIGTLDAMIPFMGDNDFMVYANLMAKLGTGVNNKNGSTFEGNAGLGVRRVNDSETAIYGAYAYFDYLRSVNDNTFHQITLGAERLGLTWDFRVNTYLPIGTTKYNKTTLDGVIIDQRNLIQYLKATSEKATPGADVEVGRTLGSDNLRGYFAVYSFGKDLTGPRARLEYKLNERVTLTGTLQHDTDRGTQYFLGARFSLGGYTAKNKNSIYNRMTDMVIRDVDIVTQAKTIESKQVLFDKFWTVDLDTGIGGDGTLENPFGTIDEAIEAAPHDAIIYVKGSGTDVINPIGDVLNVNPGQIIWGGDMPLYYDFNNDRYISEPSSNVNTKLIKAPDAGNVRQTLGGTINMADDSALHNFNVAPTKFDSFGNPTDRNGIIIDNKQNVVIDNVNVSGYKGGAEATGVYSGVLIKGDSTATLNRVTADNNDIGVYVEGGQNIIFNQLTATNSTQHGVKQTGGNLTINNSNLSQNNLSGVYTENGNLNVYGGNLSNNLENGINANNSTVNITGATIANNTLNGIYGDASHLTIDGTTIANNTVNGISLDNSSTLTDLANSQIKNNNLHGLLLNNSQATINNSIFSENGVTATENAYDINDLTSAIKINNDSTLTANGLTVQNNGAGVELAKGTITLNNSIIDGNTGYGLWAHVADSDTTSRLNINDTTISNTKTLDSGVISGHGIFTDGLKNVSLTNLNIVKNQGTGLWLRSSDLQQGRNINVIDNGSEVEKRDTLDDLYYGVRIDDGQVRSTRLTFDGLTIKDSQYHGLLVNGARSTVSVNNLISQGNEDGVLLTDGSLQINNSIIKNNNRYGIYVKNYIYGNGGSDDKTRILQLNNTLVMNTKSPDAGKDGPDYSTGHGLAVDHDATITINNTQFMNNDGFGIYAKAGTITITGDAPSNRQYSQYYVSRISNNGLGGFYHGFMSGETLNIDMSNTSIDNNRGIGLYVFQLNSLKLDGLLITNNVIGTHLWTSFSTEQASANDYGIKNSIIRDNYDSEGEIKRNLDRGNNSFANDLKWLN